MFGTVRDRNGNLLGDVKILVAAGSNAYVATSSSTYIHGSTDRNYEISNVNGMSPGTYAVYATVKVGADYAPVSPSVSVNVTGLSDDCTRAGANCTQWWRVDFKQN